MAQYALVYGGCGSLGSEAIRQFKTAGLKTISVDFAASKEADHAIQIQGKSLDEDVKSILSEVSKINASK
jgi:UDP-glucose 4-epimerase